MNGGPVGIMTGGGDAPGLNAAICGAATRLREAGFAAIGFRDGWRGVIENEACELPLVDHGLVALGGTVVGASSASPYRAPERDVPRVVATFAGRGLHALIVIGGDGTLRSAHRLVEDHGLPIVAVPKTIDNDLAGTDYTFGFLTAVERCTQAIDQLRTTADAHGRVFCVECMGRHAGWIAGFAGIASGADLILVPERAVELADVYGRLRALRAGGRRSAMLAVAEGARIHENGVLLSSDARDEFGKPVTGGTAELVAGRIQAVLGWEARAIVLGHLQRAGSPIAFDRIIALRLGARAARLVAAGRFGRMAALSHGEVTDIPLAEAVAELKLLDDHFIDLYQDFFSGT